MRTNSFFQLFQISAKTPQVHRMLPCSGGIQNIQYPHNIPSTTQQQEHMSDNEGGGAAADVDFNDDLFTCANVRFIQCYRIARKFSILFLLCVLIFFLRQQRTRASSSSSSSSLTLLLLMKNNLKHTVRCCHQVQDSCRLREWYVFIKLFFFLLVFVS